MKREEEQKWVSVWQILFGQCSLCGYQSLNTHLNYFSVTYSAASFVRHLQ